MGLEVQGMRKQLQQEIIAEYSSIPASMRNKLNFNMSALFSFDYSNPFAINQLAAMRDNLVFQKNVLLSNDEYKDKALAKRKEAEERWEEQRAICYNLSVQLDAIDKDKDPDKYANLRQKLDEAEFYRDSIYGPGMVDAVKFYNGLA